MTPTKQEIEATINRLRALIEQAVRDEQLRHQLTGLPNGSALEERLQSAIEQGQRFWLAFVEIDRFKSINDRFGYDLADGLLRESGRVMAEQGFWHQLQLQLTRPAEELSPAAVEIGEELGYITPSRKHPKRRLQELRRQRACQDCGHLDLTHYWSLDTAGCEGVYLCHRIDGTQESRACTCRRYVAPPPSSPTIWQRLHSWWRARKAPRARLLKE